MDTACRDALETLVYTNQSFKSTEAEFEDNRTADVDAVTGEAAKERVWNMNVTGLRKLSL